MKGTLPELVLHFQLRHVNCAASTHEAGGQSALLEATVVTNASQKPDRRRAILSERSTPNSARLGDCDSWRGSAVVFHFDSS